MMALKREYLEEEIKKTEDILEKLEQGKFINEAVLKIYKDALKDSN